MKEDDFKEILEHKAINKSGIAELMYPHLEKGARVRLNNKINQNAAGNGKQRLTDEDLEKGENVLRELAETILKKL